MADDYMNAKEYVKAKALYQEISKGIAVQDCDKFIKEEITKAFEDTWQDTLDNLSGGAKLNDIQW